MLTKILHQKCFIAKEPFTLHHAFVASTPEPPKNSVCRRIREGKAPTRKSETTTLPCSSLTQESNMSTGSILVPAGTGITTVEETGYFTFSVGPGLPNRSSSCMRVNGFSLGLKCCQKANCLTWITKIPCRRKTENPYNFEFSNRPFLCEKPAIMASEDEDAPRLWVFPAMASRPHTLNCSFHFPNPYLIPVQGSPAPSPTDPEKHCF